MLARAAYAESIRAGRKGLKGEEFVAPWSTLGKNEVWAMLPISKRRKEGPETS